MTRTATTVHIGRISLGGNAPVVIQSMTNTDTADAAATIRQVMELANAGSELVRITVNSEAAARAVPAIYERLLQAGRDIPLIGDFHFNGHRLLSRFPECAQALSKYRINPGNVGRGRKHDEQFAVMIETACRYHKPVRIGVNWGSFDQGLTARLMDENTKRKDPKNSQEMIHEIMVTSALESAAHAESLGIGSDRIVLSAKMSRMQDLVSVYRELAACCTYPLHLGLTEAGMGLKGIVTSTAALSVLLQEGIGDTIRLSLTPEPGGDRTREVTIARELLQALGLRNFAPSVSACPGCGRTASDYFQQLAQDIQDYLHKQMPAWQKVYPGVENMNIAVMGCVVNGPGESKHADIGISLPGTGERPVAPVYVDGEKTVTLKGDSIAADFQELVDDYVQSRYGRQM